MNCRFLLMIVIIAVVCLLLPGAALAEPDINAKAAILMDMQSGRILYAKNMDEQLPMASTTKITTAILAIEQGDLDREVRISRYAAATGEASMGLRQGEVLTVRDLLYGAMLQSGNDAAVALAEAVAGSEQEFVRQMNDFAQKVGARSSNYVNPHGLHHPEHYTTAHDLAKIARYGMKLEEFRGIVAARMQPVNRQGRSRPQLLTNKNRLLTSGKEYYPYANGIKNGYTTPAGNCLVSSAAKEGWSLLAVVLNSPDVYGESRQLLEWGFESFRREPIIEQGVALRTIKVVDGRKEQVQVVTAGDLSVALLPEERGTLRRQIILPDAVSAPVKEGEWLGELRVYMEDKQLAAVDLVAGGPVQRKSFLLSVWRALLGILTF